MYLPHQQFPAGTGTATRATDDLVRKCEQLTTSGFVLAVFGSLIAPYDPTASSLDVLAKPFSPERVTM